MLRNPLFGLYSSTYYYPKWLKKFKIHYKAAEFLVPVNAMYYKHCRIGKAGEKEQGAEKVIVSLTSFPKRITRVYLAIKSLLKQTRRPERVVLWLSKEQFPGGIESLPRNLLDLLNFGLEIRMVDGDIRSHKKYYYAFREFADDYVMLADDDILYPADTIETLLKGMKPNAIHCSYGSVVRYDASGKPEPYVKWTPVVECCSHDELFFGSGGGTLLRPSAFVPEATDIDAAFSLCPTADDIWLNAMARLSGLKIEKVRSGLFFPVSNKSIDPLSAQNNDQGRNDAQLSAIRQRYPSLFTLSPAENNQAKQ